MSGKGLSRADREHAIASRADRISRALEIDALVPLSLVISDPAGYARAVVDIDDTMDELDQETFSRMIERQIGAADFNALFRTFGWLHHTPGEDAFWIRFTRVTVVSLWVEYACSVCLPGKVA